MQQSQPQQQPQQEGRGLLNDQEASIINLLVDILNRYTELETLQGTDYDDFAQCIHMAQHLILSRPTLRTYKFIQEQTLNDRLASATRVQPSERLDPNP